jgi:DNA-binding NarL/FixJ family response regulator
MVRVVIASHQPLVRHGLHGLLAAEPEIEIVGESVDGPDAVRLARRLRPDLVLVDMGIQALDAIAVTRTIRAELRDTRVIVISGGNDDVSAVESVRAGATAYLRREARTEDLLRAIRSAVAGQVVLPAQAVARLLRSMGRHQALSERETEVLYLVARGLANKQVARDLGIAESTVKCHVSGILTKLGLPTRTQIALYAARTGLVALDRSGTDAADDGMDAWQTV